MSDDIAITNRTGEYLRIHADIEHEQPSREEKVRKILDEGFAELSFGPYSTVEEIARACAMFSNDTHEVVAYVNHISGKPVVTLRKELRPAGLDAVLRHGSDTPLMFRRQAG